MINTKGLNISVGDEVKVTFKSESKSRVTPFEGTVISIRGKVGSKTFIVRKVSKSKVAIERIFQVDSPMITDIKVQTSKKIRRAKLYYLRNK